MYRFNKHSTWLVRTARHSLLPVGLLALVAVGCSSDRALTGPAGSKSLSVSFATMPVAPAASGQMSASLLANGNLITPAGGTVYGRSLLAVSGHDTLVINKVQLVLSHVELTQVAGSSCDDDSSEPG